MELLAELDPCRIPEAVRGRFAQLTLSSNKKKESEKVTEKLGTEAEITHEGLSACKNLQDLLTEDESEIEDEELNKLFSSRTSATSSKEDNNNKDQNSSFILERLQVSMSEISEACDRTNRDDISKSLDLTNASASLFTRQDYTSNAVNQLSKQISNMGLRSPELCIRGNKKNPYTDMKIDFNKSQEDALLQEFSLGRKPPENPNTKSVEALADTVSGTLSEVITISSHRSSIPRKISLEVAPAKRKTASLDGSVLTISSSSSTPKNSSVSVSETDEEIIVLSDSESEGSAKVNVSCARPSGHTNLGSTLSNTAADRIEAFLKDIPLINAGEQQYLLEEGMLDNSLVGKIQDESIPEDSIEITETSSEGVVQEAEDHDTSVHEEEKQNSGTSETPTDNKKDSPKPSTSPQILTNISNCIEKINISATIKIKLQISEPMGTRHCDSYSDDDNKSPRGSISNEQSNKGGIDATTEGVPDKDDNKQDSDQSPEKYTSSSSKEFVSSKHFTPNKAVDSPQSGKETSVELNEKAKKLLDQLYGSSWQTPEIIKSLDKMTEESRLNFTEFNDNIKADLESTRVNQPKRQSPKLLFNNKGAKELGKMKSNKEKGVYNKENNPPIVKTKSGRRAVQRLKLVDNYLSSEEPFSASDDSWINTSTSDANDSCTERIPNKKYPNSKRNKLVYLDLSSDEVKVQSKFTTPAVNNDKNFNKRLQEILKTCKFEDKPKIEAPMTKTKRKLFTARFGEENEDQMIAPITPTDNNSSLLLDTDSVKLRTPLPPMFTPINKQLEAVKTGVPIFSVKKPTSSTKKQKNQEGKNNKKTISSDNSSSPKIGPHSSVTPYNKYGFLKSLDVSVAKTLCHPDALYYQENFKTRKDELVQILYGIYNEKLFNNELNVSIVWNKKLLNTAGRCSNKKMSSGERSSKIELSEKVLTSADRLRCTLIHELCHAATWIYNGENGHGPTWKAWARKANEVFPELPKIGVCHQYDIEYKYTYKCTLCGAKSHAHSKSKKVENIRCSFCHGAIEVFLNKKDKEGNIISTPVKQPSGFAKFVKEKYKVYRKPDLKHTDVMKILSNEFASLNIAERNKY